MLYLHISIIHLCINKICMYLILFFTSQSTKKCFSSVIAKQNNENCENMPVKRKLGNKTNRLLLFCY